jgi:transcriptional regulator with XRE-family HTH domain
LLGKNIARFRRQALLTQEELAEKTDYSVDFIGLVERGINAPTLSRLQDIALVMGVDVWQLFYPNNGENSNGGMRKAQLRRPKKRTIAKRLTTRQRVK